MAIQREIDCEYSDPLDLIWLETARTLGMEVERSAAVYAAWDGKGVLYIADSESMDPDDCVAQMVFHEVCHALVEGPGSWGVSDWGLVNRDDRHLVREHACHRLQAALSDRYGLRRLLGVTTDHRAYYDALPLDPLSGDDPAVVPACRGWERATTGPWAEALDHALCATAQMAQILKSFSSNHSLWSRVVDPL